MVVSIGGFCSEHKLDGDFQIKMEESRTRLCRLRPGCWDCFEICSALFGHINFVHFQPPCPAWGAREDGRAEHDIMCSLGTMS